MIRTSILVNGTDIDLFEDIPQSYNYAIADIRNPEARNASYSKTLRIPGSPANNKLFSHIFDIGAFTATSGVVNFDPDFNPNLKADCRIFVDSVMVMKGILKLDNIIRNDQQRIEYECTVWGNTANIIAALGDKMLQDLDFDDLNHTYNRTNQKNSWSAAVGNGYVYPMIDYGNNFPNQYGVGQFFPAIYLREYIKRIFKFAGYQLESTWLDTTYTKSLIIPFNGDKLLLTAAQINLRKFRASRHSTDQTQAVTTDSYGIPSVGLITILFNNDSVSPNEDTGSNYDTATGKYTVPNSGYYDFYTEVQLALSAGSGNGSVSIDVQIWKDDISNIGNMVAGAGQTQIVVTNTNTFTIPCTAANLGLNTGEKIYARIKINPGTAMSASFTLNIKAGSYFINRIINTGLVDGDTLDMNMAVPPAIKMRELLMETIKTYNLYMETDKNIERKIYLEPYTSFYTSGTTRDWTAKLDTSQDVQITPMGALDAKRYIFKFKDDSDYWNDKYKKRWGETYGLKFIDVNNDWIKSYKTLEVLFSPTPLAIVPGTDRIISQIYAVDQAGNKSKKVSNLRLLFYGGVKNTLYPWTYITAAGNFTEATYPYAGHLDDVLSPNYDVNFGVPREVYYNITSGSTYTDDNIYNEYHSQFITEITNRNSKLVTGYFRLTTLDIALLDFRDLIFVDGYNYRINKVMDYNPLKDGTTKVELLKKKDGVPYARIKTSMIGVQSTMGNDLTPVMSDPIDGGLDNNSGGGAGSPTGRFAGNSRGNRIGNMTSGVTVESCELCVVGDGCARVAVFNSSGCTIEPGLSDVLVMNSSGITVSSSSTTVMNNVIQGKGIGWTKTVSADYTVAVKDSLIFVNNTAAATITLDTTVADGKEYTIKKLSGAGLDVTIAGGGLNIDGAGTKVLSTQYNSYTIRKVGNDWFIT